MAAIDLGASVTVSWPNSPAGTIAATVTQPDGTAFVGTLTVTQSSPASVQFVPTMPGRHAVRLTSTGAAFGAYQDVVNVWPADDRFIISLQDAMDALSWPGQSGNLTAAQLANENDLRLYLASATGIIEDFIGGPVIYGQYTYTADGGKPTLILPGNVNSIVSVTEIGYPVTMYVWDPIANTLSAGSTVAPRRFMPSVRGVVVTYTGGFQVIPADIILAARELVRHWWSIGKQGFRPATAGMPSGDPYPGMSYALPRRVEQLLAPYQRKAPGGFA